MAIVVDRLPMAEWRQRAVSRRCRSAVSSPGAPSRKVAPPGENSSTPISASSARITSMPCGFHCAPEGFSLIKTSPDVPRVVRDEQARELWPGTEAIGKRIRFGDLKSTAPWQTVVGVVGRVKHTARDGQPHRGGCRRCRRRPARFVTVRATAIDQITSSVRSRCVDDPNLPIYRMRR
jgi:hypothetical protein